MGLLGKLPAIAFTVMLLLTAALEGANFILQNGSDKIGATLTNAINQHIPGTEINFSSAKLQFGWKEASIRVADLRLSNGNNTLIAPQADVWLKTDGVIVVLTAPDITFSPAVRQTPLIIPGKYWSLAADNALIRWHDKAAGVSLTLQQTDLQMRYENGDLAAEIINHHPRNKLHARAQLNLQHGLRGTVHAILEGWHPPPNAVFGWDNINITARAVIDNAQVQFAAASKLQQPHHSRLAANVAAIEWVAQGDFAVGGAATITIAAVAQTLQLADFADVPPLDAEMRGVLTYESKNNRWQLRGDETTATAATILLTARLTASGYGATVVEFAATDARLANVPLNSLWKYVKHPEARKWFVDSLREGIIENGYANFRANFLPTLALHAAVTAVFRGGRVEIGDGWPAATKLNGVVVIQDDNIRIVGEGMMAGVATEEVTVYIPGIAAARTTLFMNARFAQAEFADYLAAIKQLPPISQAAATHTEGLQLSADAKLSLMLAVPLAMPQDAVFKLRLRLQNGQLQTTANLPPLHNLAGEMRADNNGGQVILDGKFQGEAITLYADGETVLLQGRVAASTALSVVGVDDFWASGVGDFSLSIAAASTVFMSSLHGIQINLPSPFDKPPQISAFLSVRVLADEQQAILKLGDNLFRLVGDSFGGGGVDIAVNTDSLPSPSVGVRFHGSVNSNIDSGDIMPFTAAGTLLYRPGVVHANLAHWTMPNISAANEAIGFDMRNLTVDIAIDKLQFGEALLGTLTLSGAPYRGGWRLQQMLLSDGGNTLSLSGRYNGGQTFLTLRLNALAAPQLLRQINLDNIISEGNMLVEGHVFWRQTPLNFSLAALGGRLSLRAEGLRYLKSSGNGVINLLAIFSPQSLLSLGFTEIGKEGIYINLLTGEIIFADGRIVFENLAMENKDLNISLQGETNWENKNLNLNGRVRPGNKLIKASSIITLGAGVAAITPVSLAAGWFLGKIFEKPLSEIGAYDYQIGGDWENPVYTETGITYKPPPPIAETPTP